MSEGLSYVPPEVREQEKQFNPPTEFTSRENKIKFWLAFFKNDGYVFETEQKAREQAEESVDDKEQNGMRYFGVTDQGGEVIASGSMKIITKEGEKHAYLGLLTVDARFRGKGIAKQLTDIRTEVARSEGCAYIDTSVRHSNPIALVTKFNDGFSLVNLEYYDPADTTSGWFDLTKPINDEPTYDKKVSVGELREVNLSDLAKIKSLLNENWVGIDIKNLDQAANKDSKQWNLIMEKVS